MSDENQAGDATEMTVPDAPTAQAEPDYLAIMAHPQFQSFLQMEVMVRAYREQVLTAAFSEVTGLPDGNEKSEAQAVSQLMASVGQLAAAYVSLCKRSLGWSDIELISVPAAVSAIQMAESAAAPANEPKAVAG